MNPGLLRHRITIEKREDTQDALGQPSRSWVSYRKVWARVMQPKSSDGDQASRGQESHHLVFRVRYQPSHDAIVQDDRIQWKGQQYDIHGTTRANDGRDEWLDITASHNVTRTN